MKRSSVRQCASRRAPVVTSACAALLSLNTIASAQSRIGFVEITDQAGLSGAVRDVANGSRYSSMQGGGVVGDFNNDGYHDIFMLAGGGVGDYLYINNQDGTFTDQASQWGVDQAHYSFGASAADFNNDGYLDVFITSYGSTNFAPASGKMLLLKNNGPDSDGNWSFSDVAVACGVNRLFGNTRDGLGSGWSDYDLDGDLDLMVCGYVEDRSCNRLFRNDGENQDGTTVFTDATVEAGLELTDTPGFTPQFVDMDGDLYPELILIADTGTSKYFHNAGDGTFVNMTHIVGGVNTANAMGIDVGDINDDGLLDLYISSITYDLSGGPGNVLLIQQPDGTFENTARDNGTSEGYWGWGVLMQDFDHDRDLDLAETNGFFGPYSGNPAVLFENLGDGDTFSEVAHQAGFLHTGQGRGMSRIDIENDGDLDIVIFENVGQLRLYENLLIDDEPTPADRNWVRIALDTSDRDTLAPQGLGSSVTIYTGNHSRILPIHCGTNHACSSPIETHAGLDDATSIDTIQVRWNDGSFTTLTDIDSNQMLTISASSSPSDYVPDGSLDVHDVLAFLDRYNANNLSADHNGDLRLNYYDVAGFIRDFLEAR
jgi:hypothetical protein